MFHSTPFLYMILFFKVTNCVFFNENVKKFLAFWKKTVSIEDKFWPIGGRLFSFALSTWEGKQPGWPLQFRTVEDNFGNIVVEDSPMDMQLSKGYYKLMNNQSWFPLAGLLLGHSMGIVSTFIFYHRPLPSFETEISWPSDPNYGQTMDKRQ